MGAIDTVTAFVAALNAQQWPSVASYLADDFTFTGGAPVPLGKQGLLAGEQAWFTGVPDRHLTFENARTDGNTVSGTTRVTGTQTKPLAFPGMSPIPATGKRFATAIPTTITMHGDKIAAITLAPASPTIFEQLGVQPPA
ncbi:MAG TPA: nuclear transport factor 2 family protein [Ktedonobacterales bacterium]